MPCGSMIDGVEAGAGEAVGAEGPHGFLRRVTRPWHDGVEQAFERFDLQTVVGLRGFLVRQAVALVPVERALELSGVDTILPDWPARRRTALILDDLAHLDAAAPDIGTVPGLQGSPAMLGALYVLEGSKLGSRVLHRRLLASPDPRVRRADRFLGHRQHRGWPDFLAVLDASACDAAAREGLAEGARRAFATFHAAAERETVPVFTDAPTRFGRYHPAHV